MHNFQFKQMVVVPDYLQILSVSNAYLFDHLLVYIVVKILSELCIG
jgi:hypothetical protein